MRTTASSVPNSAPGMRAAILVQTDARTRARAACRVVYATGSVPAVPPRRCASNNRNATQCSRTCDRARKSLVRKIRGRAAVARRCRTMQNGAERCGCHHPFAAAPAGLAKIATSTGAVNRGACHQSSSGVYIRFVARSARMVLVLERTAVAIVADWYGPLARQRGERVTSGGCRGCMACATSCALSCGSGWRCG